MNDDQEHLLNCLARHVLRTCGRDAERIREWLAGWRERHGDESADDLRRRCRREWKARADAMSGVRGEA